MARVTGPLFSLEASGTIAKTATFAKWKGRQYVRQRVVPSNPRTAGQVAVRAALTFLAQVWKLISPINQATWDVAAKQASVSPFNAYLAFNAREWSDLVYPAQSLPITVQSNTSSLTISAVGGKGSATVTIDETVVGDPFGIAIFALAAASDAPTRDTCVAMKTVYASGTVQFLIPNLSPGTYYFTAVMFDNFGNPSAYPTGAEAVVT